jgi:pyruvate-formate lyase-activating enzyme/SAM-dependent methyltransferase
MVPARPTRALLKLGYACNNACRFCHALPHRGLDLDLAEARRRIDWVADAGASQVVLSGGEPTIRADLVDLVHHAARRGLSAGLISNGRMLAYDRLRRDLVAAGLRDVWLSIHGHRAATHDGLVRAPAHAYAWAALTALLRTRGVRVVVTCVLTRPNLGEVAGLADALAALPGQPRTLRLSFVEPEGAVLADADALVPTLREAAAAVAPLLGRPGRLSVRVDGFPPCVLPGARDATLDLFSEGFVSLAEAFEDRLHPVDDRNRRRGEPCRACSLDGCPGGFTQYLALRGDAELTPDRSCQGSSLDLVRSGRPLEGTLRRCPARHGETPHPDPRLGLWLVQDGRITACTARADALDERLHHRVRRDWGQLYLATGSRAGAGSLATGLEKLHLAATCATCPHRAHCGGAHRFARKDVFRRDEAAVRRFLGGLSGRVLEVGGGAVPYLDAYRPALAAGHLELHVLDPDAAALSGLPPLPGLVPWVGTLETHPRSGARFDHVLSVRSYSHLDDLDASAQRVTGLLRPGGRLTIIGDTPIALVRSPRAVARSHRDPTLRLEHRRGHGAREAWDLLKRYPFDLEDLADPVPTGSNLWWLWLRRRPT